MRSCQKGAALNRKRLKKTLRRRYVKKVKTRLYVTYGAYIGSMMYRTWRNQQAQKGMKTKNPNS